MQSTYVKSTRVRHFCNIVAGLSQTQHAIMWPSSFLTGCLDPSNQPGWLARLVFSLVEKILTPK